jgi:hypothetical protein
MMDINFANFHKEHQKQKQKLVFFEDVLYREQQLKDEKKRLSKTKFDQIFLASKARLVEDDLKRLKARQNREESDHEAKNGELRKKVGDVQAILFNIHDPAPSNTSSRSIEQLEAAAELANLNSLLFEQQLRIKKRAEAILIAQEQFDQLSQELAREMESIPTIESNIGVAETALRDAKLNWARMRMQAVAESQETRHRQRNHRQTEVNN